MTRPLKHDKNFIYEKSGYQFYPSTAKRFVELLYALDETPGLTTRELAELLGWKESTTRYYLWLSHKDGDVVKEFESGNGRYRRYRWFLQQIERE